MTDSNSILIRGLKVRTHIGVPDEERATPQELLLHLEVWPKNRFEAMADEVEKTVDYHRLSLMIDELSQARPRQLIETLAADICELVLAEDEVAAVSVEIEKRILPQTDWVGCRMYRSQA